MADESRPRSAKGSTPPWQQDGEPEEGLGASLKKHRQGLEISLQQISEQTRISESILEAIEADRYDDLPASVFVRGFLRQYARFVGLDADQVVSQYGGSRAGRERDPIPISDIDSGADAGAWVWVATGVLLAAVAAGYWFYGRSTTAGNAQASASAVVEGPGDVTSGAANGQRDDLREPPQATPLPAAGVSADESEGPQTGEPGESGTADDADAPTPLATPLRVTIDFVEDCWVESTVDGVRQISTLYAKGESLRLEAENQLRVFLGNYTGAVVQINGRQYDWPVGDPQDATRELNIDAEFMATLGGAAPGPSESDASSPAQAGVDDAAGPQTTAQPRAGERNDAQAPFA